LLKLETPITYYKTIICIFNHLKFGQLNDPFIVKIRNPNYIYYKTIICICCVKFN